MGIVSGKIAQMELVEKPFPKLITTISTSDGGQAFVEFRTDPMLKAIKPFKVGDEIAIFYKHEGKISKNTGVKYNNLIAEGIDVLT